MMISMSLRRKVKIGLNPDPNHHNSVEEADASNPKLFLVHKYNTSKLR